MSNRLAAYLLDCANVVPGVAAKAHKHALSEGQITLVCQRRVHKLRCIALVFVSVIELGVYHSDDGHPAFIHVKSQLPLPCPVAEVFTVLGEQLINHINVVDYVHD